MTTKTILAHLVGLVWGTGREKTRTLNPRYYEGSWPLGLEGSKALGFRVLVPPPTVENQMEHEVEAGFIKGFLWVVLHNYRYHVEV